MKLSRDNYSDVFLPEPTDAAVERMWRGVRERQNPAPKARSWLRAPAFLVPAFASAAAAAALSISLSDQTSPGAQDQRQATAVQASGSVTSAARTEAEVVGLPDGSRVQVAPLARLETLTSEQDRIALRLQRGKASFFVTKRAQRSFEVLAKDVTVSVVGTTFEVDLGTDAKFVTVRVTEGRVKVEEGSKPPVLLSDGDVWSNAPTGEQPAAEETEADEPPGSNTTTPTWTRPGKSKSPSEAAALLQKANQARVAGRTRDAIAIYEQLRHKYPDDPRASLAALQIGRLKMELGQDEQATEALSQAAKSGGATQEDAAARLVYAYDRAGDLEQCRAARTNYLRRYPSGTHAKAVEQSCKGR